MLERAALRKESIVPRTGRDDAHRFGSSDPHHALRFHDWVASTCCSSIAVHRLAQFLLELRRRDDELAKWAKRNGKMFVPIDEQIQIAVKEILRDHRRLIDTRRGRSGADPFLIALAKIRGAAVVTDEAPSGTLEKPKIPDVCQALGIECWRLTDMFENEGITFSDWKTVPLCTTSGRYAAADAA